MTLTPDYNISNLSRTREESEGSFFNQRGGLRDAPEEFDIASPRDIRPWSFIVQETTRSFIRGARISGQFTPQQVQENIGSNVSEGGGFSRSSPILQWVSGKLRSFTFQARLFSEYAEDDTAERKKATIEALLQRDEELGRPPLLAFFWGNVIPDGFSCVITDIGNSYDEIRDDGSIRGVTMQITIKQHVPYIVEQIASTSEERTPLHEVKDGESYESIALKYYGDPIFGVLLRQMNPRQPYESWAPSAVADLQAGEKVKIYSKKDITSEKIRPLSPVLRRDNFIASNNRRVFFENRSTIRGIIPKR